MVIASLWPWSVYVIPEYSAIPANDFAPSRKSLISGTEKAMFSPPGPSIE